MDPLVEVRERLAAARANGQRFCDAWPAAIDGTEGLDRAALEATRGDWMAAYLDEPAPPPIRAVSLLHLDRSLSAPRDEHEAAAPTIADRQRIYGERDSLRFTTAPER